MKRPEHVHFVGIGGYGMSAIARVMLDMGYQVTGSDLSDQELIHRLSDRGATIFRGHDPSHVKEADLVVYSTALPQDNVELEAARRLHIPVIHRSEMLARLMNDRLGIAVAGAHGKTTTTSMIAFIMERCGLDPTFVVGGIVRDIGENAKAGTGQFLVAEADESDGSFLNYRPQIAVVTNIEPDHLEYYDGNFENLCHAYGEFIGNVAPQGLCVISAADRKSQSLRSFARCRVQTFAIDAPADIIGREVQLVDRGSRFVVYQGEARLGEVRLSVPGQHNILDALAALTVCLEVGLPFWQIAAVLSDFHGAKRRFQVIAEVAGVLIVDDYAHHPTEIQATLAGAQATGRRIIAVFQPQRYTRTYFLFDEFTRSFLDADEVVLTDIYSPSGERRIEGVSSEKLADQIRLQSNPHVRYYSTKDQVFEYLLSTVHEGDLVLTMGAGDIWQVAARLGNALHEQEQSAVAN
ncbi:UDP-N-acetylmuramate--L-alanine ligase [Alicyclobacillaceae bacterium I2511]|nr:UDP-N-acetylmuramate--L-alanine ligase [Alicyclobacillaceae bacterium I2511]